MEFRKVFDTIPEQFDTYRPRYSEKLFAELVSYADIKPGKRVLELGPGTGQATEPILNTGCDYYAIELGGNLAHMMKSKYGAIANFDIVNADFITHTLYHVLRTWYPSGRFERLVFCGERRNQMRDDIMSVLQTLYHIYDF